MTAVADLPVREVLEPAVAALALLDLEDGRLVRLRRHPRIVRALEHAHGQVPQVRHDALLDVDDVGRPEGVDGRDRSRRGDRRREEVRVVRAQHPGPVAAHGVAADEHLVRGHVEGATGLVDEGHDPLLGARVGPAALGGLEGLGVDREPAALVGRAAVCAVGARRVGAPDAPAVQADEEALGLLGLPAEEEAAAALVLPVPVLAALPRQLASVLPGLLDALEELLPLGARRRLERGVGLEQRVDSRARVGAVGLDGLQLGEERFQLTGRGGTDVVLGRQQRRGRDEEGPRHQPVRLVARPAHAAHAPALGRRVRVVHLHAHVRRRLPFLGLLIKLALQQIRSFIGLCQRLCIRLGTSCYICLCAWHWIGCS